MCHMLLDWEKNNDEKIKAWCLVKACPFGTIIKLKKKIELNYSSETSISVYDSCLLDLLDEAGREGHPSSSCLSIRTGLYIVHTPSSAMVSSTLCFPGCVCTAELCKIAFLPPHSTDCS